MIAEATQTQHGFEALTPLLQSAAPAVIYLAGVVILARKISDLYQMQIVSLQKRADMCEQDRAALHRRMEELVLEVAQLRVEIKSSPVIQPQQE